MDASVCGCQPRVDEDDALQSAVLAILIDAHPAQRSEDELVRELTAEPDDVAQRDAAENAIRELVGAGLAHRHGAFVFATHAAVRFDELWS
ncbi:MAG: hypothetical protein V7607_4663 [Solirubrobacteraceae bacterium]